MATVLTRLIPARAGNMYRHVPWWKWSSAHPRSRGEHVHTSSSQVLPIGSSPLARGTSGVLQDIFRWRRLIPARAGNISR